MFEALIPCLSGLQLTSSNYLPKGFWSATNLDQVVGFGRLNIMSIPMKADTLHLNIEDFRVLKAELERKL